MAFLGSIGKTVQKVVSQVIKNPLQMATLVAAGPFAAAAAGKIQKAVQGLGARSQSGGVQTVMAAQDQTSPQQSFTTMPYFPQQGPSPIYYQPYDTGGLPSWDYSTSQPISSQATGADSWGTFSERAISEHLAQRAW